MGKGRRTRKRLRQERADDTVAALEITGEVRKEEVKLQTKPNAALFTLDLVGAGGGATRAGKKDARPHKRAKNAVFDTGLRVIQMPSKWGHARGHLQAAHTLLWWPCIEKTISEMNQRECYRPDWNIKQAADMALKKVTIDFQKAQKKRRKARK